MSDIVSGEISVGEKKDPKSYSQVMRDSKSSSGVFSAFMVRPKGVSLEIQEENEQILLLVRRHFITNTGWILLVIVMIIVPGLFQNLPLGVSIPARFLVITSMLWTLLIITIVLEGLLSWYFDVFIVTDERVIDIDFRNLIYKNITSAKIDNIQDVTYNVSGPLPSFLDYGMVFIQTASEVPMIEIANTPHPSKVAKFINEMILQEEQEKLEGRAR
jgi:hypothetical protein